MVKSADKPVDPMTATSSEQSEPLAAESSDAPVQVSTQDSDKSEISIEKKLVALYSLQQIDSQIDRIRIVRGELPLEVEDLEDEIAGLETRIDNHIQDVQSVEKQLYDRQIAIKDCQTLIKRYEEQQNNVRNNREYDALTKEIEFQSLEIQLAEKRIREFNTQLAGRKEEIEEAQRVLAERRSDLDVKRNELADIVTETELEEKSLIHKSETQQSLIEERLLTAYKRIRKNARNGLAVVTVERDACGGCFNAIPPQRQLDIRLHKKIIVCEYCGRILVDKELANSIAI